MNAEAITAALKDLATDEVLRVLEDVTARLQAHTRALAEGLILPLPARYETTPAVDGPDAEIIDLTAYRAAVEAGR